MHTPRVSRVTPQLQSRTRQFQLKIITPVHIGGRRQRLRQNRFACVENYCYVLNELRFYHWLQRHTRVEDYVSTALAHTADLNHLEECLRVLFRERRLAEMLSQIAAYRVYRPQSASQPAEIYPFLRNQSSQPYVPGTAIKGAIRTAVLYHVVQHHPDVFAPQLALRDGRDRLGHEIVRRALQELPLRSPYTDAPLASEVRDILKTVQVGDSIPLERDALGLHEIKVLSEKYTNSLGPIPGVHWSGGDRGFTLHAEVIRPEQHTNQPLQCTLTVDARALKAYVPEASLMPFTLEESPTAVAQLLAMCQTFADRMAEDELEYFVRLQNVPPESTNAAVQKGIQEAVEGVINFYRTTFRSERPNLRLGWGSGLLGTTVWPWLRHEASKDIQRELQARIPHPDPNRHVERRGAGNSFPKSRKLDVTAKAPDADRLTTLPLGWCRLEPRPETL